MAKIAFYANNLTERGTAVALYDYARYARDLQGHDSVVLYDATFEGNNPQVIQRFQAEFPLIPTDSFTQADAQVRSEGCDLIYVLKAGKRDGLISRAVPTMVHAVFSSTVRQVHGASYAYVSEWLSQHCSNGHVPWVPHMITIGDTDADLRAELGLTTDQLVFGCYGGRTSFDIDFVRDVAIPRVLEARTDVVFLFMNIDPFMDHPRVQFLPGSVDLERKTAFINSCDAMLHGRRRGETFGLAVGEFALRNKPVLTFGRSKETAHLDVLGASALIYRDADELFTLITGFDRSAPSARAAYLRLFSPASVMARFEDALIAPALQGDWTGAQKRLGLHRWNPALIARPKLRKLANALR